MSKVLVTYATWTGATRQVAEAIGDVLSDEDTQVDVLRAREVGDIGPYSSAVVGTSVHAGQLPSEVRRFVKSNRDALRSMPVAFFVVCYTMNEDTPENRHTASGYLDRLRKAAPEVEPVDTGLFAGAVLTDTEEYRRQFPLLKLPLRGMADDPGDHRDWDAIRAWAEGLRAKLLRPAAPE